MTDVAKIQGRQTSPTGFSPYSTGGAGIIPRRGLERPDALLNRFDLAAQAVANPQRLLMLLRSMHPTLSQATSSVLGMLCPPGDIKIVGTLESAEGEGDDAEDPKATEILRDFFDGLPSEIGGVEGLAATGILSLLFTGMTCLEAVPGPSGTGVAALWPVDSLTVWFGRKEKDAPLTPFQLQTQSGDPWKELDTETFHWADLPKFADEAYAEALYAPALNECLADVRLMQDLRDAFHHTAWPRVAFSIDLSMLIEFAKEKLKMTAEKATEWGMARYAEFVEKADDMKADDTLFLPGNGKIDILEGGRGFGNNTAVMDVFARRLTQSLKTLPIFLGINDSTTETQATVQFAVQALILEQLRATAVSVIVWAANLHLRLLGNPAKAKAVYEAIRTTDALVEAQTDQIRLNVNKELVRLGAITPDEFARRMTGSGMADKSKAGAFDSQPQGQPPQGQQPDVAKAAGLQWREVEQLAKATSWEHAWRVMGITDPKEQARIRKERATYDVTFDNRQ
ncbi:MAG TPA: hypothetical protein VGM37_01335 [Armatimonadota bacterium]|jgi:hypothetical protein